MFQKKVDSARIRKIAIWVCVAVILLCVAYLVWYTISSRANVQAQQETARQYAPTAAPETTVDTTPATEETKPKYDLLDIDFQSLQEKSKYVIGWIQIPALEGVSYPICWNGSNSYYLDHSWDDQSTAYGAIFMDAYNNPEFTEPYQILYGHAMNDGSMFAGLGNYTNESFYRKNGGTMFIYLPEEVRVYEIFCGAKINCLDDVVYNTDYYPNNRYAKALEYMQDLSAFGTELKLDENSKVVTLSTCAGPDHRIVAIAVQVDTIPRLPS